MRRRVTLGEWKPDLPTLEAPGLHRATNCFPRLRGKGPVRGLEALSSYGALTARARGAITLADVDGDPENFAGDATKLYRITGGAITDASKVGGYTAGGRWEFAIFASEATGRKPVVVATDYTDPIQAFELGTSTDFDDLTAALADPDGAVAGAPRARHIATVGPRLFTGYTFDDTDGLVPNRVWWGAIGNPRSFPVPETETAINVGSDYEVLQGDGGEITRICAAADVGAIFQEHAVWRADYVGGSEIYSLRRVESVRGCIVPHMAVPFGNRVLYLSEEGWFIFNYDGSIAVGKDKIDDTFWADFQWDHRLRMSYLVDSRATRILVGYTGVGHTGGRPNRILVYDWALNEFGLIELEHECLTRVRNPGPNLSIDALPDDVPDDQIGSWDDVVEGLGMPGAYSTAHELSTFTGTTLAAEIETADLELHPGRRSLLTSVRPIVTDGTPTIAVAPKRHQQTALAWGSEYGLNEHGECSPLVDARYHRLRLSIAEGWTGDSLALDIEAQNAGRY